MKQQVSTAVSCGEIKTDCLKLEEIDNNQFVMTVLDGGSYDGLQNPCDESNDQVVFSQKFIVVQEVVREEEGGKGEFDALLGTVKNMEEKFAKYQDEYLESLMTVKMKLKEMKRSHSEI